MNSCILAILLSLDLWTRGWVCSLTPFWMMGKWSDGEEGLEGF